MKAITNRYEIEFLRASRADPGLLEELNSMPGGTTDDLRDPYS